MKKIILTCIAGFMCISLYAQNSTIEKDLFHLLTKDSVGYWEWFNDNYYYRYTYGFSFTADSIWTEYRIDAQGKRVIKVTSSRIFGYHFKFYISHDTLFLCDRDSLQENYIDPNHVMKIEIVGNSTIRLIYMDDKWNENTQDTYIGEYRIDFDFAKDQITQPQFGRLLYPNDRNCWWYGDMSDGPARYREDPPPTESPTK